jgi:hypothetical protein
MLRRWVPDSCIVEPGTVASSHREHSSVLAVARLGLGEFRVRSKSVIRGVHIHVPSVGLMAGELLQARSTPHPKLMGAHGPRELRLDQLIRRVRHHDSDSYAELYDWLTPEELLGDPPPDWASDWKRADPDRFGR